jgi:hypothetical protein
MAEKTLVRGERVCALDYKHAFGLKLLGSEVKLDLVEPRLLADFGIGHGRAFGFVPQNPKKCQHGIFVHI